MEIPLDLINNLQISLRRQANLSSYHPKDTSFTDLPSAEQAAAELDPSPPYLRCRNCRARLLRGLQSSICVFCGRQPFHDTVPDPINFRTTVGFRWLLDSLDLDGSEVVEACVEENGNKSRKRAAAVDEFPLSDILDLEIKWSSDSDDFGSRLSNDKVVQSNAAVNLSGVNVESFFSNEEKKGSTPVSRNFTSEETNNLSLFDGAQLSKTEDKSSYSDSGWGANFQSGPSVAANVDASSFDPFAGSTNLSSRMDEVFGAKDYSSGVRKEEPAASIGNDWFSDNSGFSGSSPREIKADVGLNNSTAVGDVSNATEELKNSVDSFDDWNDFASLTTLPHDDKNSGLNFDASALDRSSDGIERVNDVSTVEDATPNSEDVETILSQMHDLSFMLDSNLSVPSFSRD